MFIGLILVAIGIIALLIKLGVITGSVWSYAWPVILIILGVLFLWRQTSRRWFWRGFGGCCSPEGEDKPEKQR